MKPELSVEIGSLKLANPVLASSGTLGYGLEFAHLVDLNRIGGFVVKGLSLEPLNGAPGPRLCETPSGMLNSVGLQNVGVRAFVAEKLPKLRQYRSAVIANVFGTIIEEYVEVIRILENSEGLSGYELNISCPNVKKGGMQFGSDPGMTAEVVGAARKAALSARRTAVRATSRAADTRSWPGITKSSSGGNRGVNASIWCSRLSVISTVMMARVGRVPCPSALAQW